MHICLVPMLEDFLINETIIPVSSGVHSYYTPEQNLKSGKKKSEMDHNQVVRRTSNCTKKKQEQFVGNLLKTAFKQNDFHSQCYDLLMAETKKAF